MFRMPFHTAGACFYSHLRGCLLGDNVAARLSVFVDLVKPGYLISHFCEVFYRPTVGRAKPVVSSYYCVLLLCKWHLEVV